MAAGASAAYSLRDDTVSALGMAACSPGHAGSALDVCSPGHGLMNAAFVAFGLLRAGAPRSSGRGSAGGVGSGRRLALGRLGLAAAAVGLAPVDQQPGWHVVAALPVFVLQPLAVLATAGALRRSAAVPPGVWVAGQVVGAVTLAAAAAFGARLGGPTWVGGLERLALWPAYVWLGVVALALLVASRSETVANV